MQKERPIGVTIVAILTVIHAIILIATGVFAVVFAPQIITDLNKGIMSNVTITDQQGQEVSTNLGTVAQAASTAAVIAGAVAIAIGIVWLVLAWGLFTAKGWAWIITVILAIISAIFSAIGVFGGAVWYISTLIIDIVILYYMYRPNVKSYFGRVKIPR